MSVETTSKLETLAAEYIRAYNEADYEALEAILAENVHMLHHSRNSDTTGRDANIENMKTFQGILPDRKFTNRTLLQQLNDSQVVVKHVWGGTANIDLPGFAEKDVPFQLPLATFMTFSDGRLVDYEDYG